MSGPGERLGDYELGSPLGQGASSHVFRAVRLSDRREVACKVLAPERLADPRLEARFRREAELAASVEHANLVGFLEFIELTEPPTLAYVMELVPGFSLREHLDRELALDVPEAIEVGLGLSRALCALHGAGIVHRDLKPENVLLRSEVQNGPERVMLFDYGVACRVAAGAPDPEPAVGLVGTPRYMAPEQAAGRGVDSRADLYSLGVILFEMLSGQRPHEGESLTELIRAKFAATPRLELGAEREILPAGLSELVDACLQRKPRDRPRDAQVVLGALEECRTVLSAAGRIRLDQWIRTVPAGVAMRSPSGAGREVFQRELSRPEPKSLEPEPEVRSAGPEALGPASVAGRRPVAGRWLLFALALLLLLVLLSSRLSR